MRITISAESRALLEAHSVSGILVGATPTAAGRFEIEIDYEVATRLTAIDGDVDVAIRTLCTGMMGNA